jgi:hypothetical protein
VTSTQIECSSLMGIGTRPTFRCSVNHCPTRSTQLMTTSWLAWIRRSLSRRAGRRISRQREGRGL